MEKQEKTILDQLSVLYRRKWVFIIPLAAGTLIGAVTGVLMPRSFTSSTTVLAEGQQVPAEYVSQTDPTPFAQRLTVLSQKIMSRSNLLRIARELRLSEPGGFNVIGKALDLLKRPGAEESMNDPVIDQIRNGTKFEVNGEVNPKKGGGQGSNMFSISFSGPDPRTTMQVTSALASLFIEENMKVREEFVEGTTEFLDDELGRSKSELEKYESAIKGFKENHMGSLPEQLDANLRTLDRLQGELQTVSANIQTSIDKRAVLEEQLNSVSPDGKTLSPAASELFKLKNELSILMSRYKDNYPDVILAKKRIKELESELGKAPEEKLTRNPQVYAELMGVKSQINTLKQRETEIRKQIKEYERRVEQAPANEQLQADLQRDYKIALDNYQALLAKSMNAKLAENLEKKQKGERFRIVDPAFLPLAPDKPNRLVVTGIGAAAGGGLGVGLVFLFEFLNPAFRKPEEFEGVLPSPVLASIPVFSPETGNLTVLKGRKDIA